MAISKSKYKRATRDLPRRNFAEGNCMQCGCNVCARQGYIVYKKGNEVLICQDCLNERKRKETSQNIAIAITSFASKILSKKPKIISKKSKPQKIKLVYTAMETNRRKH